MPILDADINEIELNRYKRNEINLDATYDDNDYPTVEAVRNFVVNQTDTEKIFEDYKNNHNGDYIVKQGTVQDPADEAQGTWYYKLYKSNTVELYYMSDETIKYNNSEWTGGVITSNSIKVLPFNLNKYYTYQASGGNADRVNWVRPFGTYLTWAGYLNVNYKNPEELSHVGFLILDNDTSAKNIQLDKKCHINLYVAGEVRSTEMNF